MEGGFRKHRAQMPFVPFSPCKPISVFCSYFCCVFLPYVINCHRKRQKRGMDIYT